MNAGYLALEIRRALRAPGTLLFTIGFPAGFYLLEMMIFNDIAGGSDPDLPLEIMIGLTAWGVMTAGLLTGTRIVHERTVGWQRQLRLTPLSGGGFLLAKVAVGMSVALPTALVVPVVAVLFEGVQLTPVGWLHAVVFVWLGSLPFAIMGLLIGQFANKDNVQNFVIISMLLLAMFGGLFMSLDMLPPWWTEVAQFVPSFWLAEIGRAGVLPGHDLLMPVLIQAGWAVVLAAAVILRYQRDSART